MQKWNREVMGCYVLYEDESLIAEKFIQEHWTDFMKVKQAFHREHMRCRMFLLTKTEITGLSDEDLGFVVRLNLAKHSLVS